MCNFNNTTTVKLWIQKDLSCDGIARWKDKQIDSCIAFLVKALSDAGIKMRSSCCGHGKGEGEITLQDGRMLLILSPDDAASYLKWVSKDKNLMLLIRQGAEFA